MIRTTRGAAGAMVAVVFVLASGCTPEFERSAGPLVVTIEGVPQAATTVSIALGTSGAGYEAELDATGGSLVHRIASVPEGFVEVDASAGGGGETLASGRRTLTVVPDTENRVTVSLSPEGEAVVVSAPLPASIPEITGDDFGAGVLSDAGPLEPTALAAFIADARARLGRDPVAFEVRSVSVEVLRATSVDIEDLDDLFEDAFAVFLEPPSGAPSVRVATGTPPDDTRALDPDVVATSEDLDPLVAALTSTDVRVRVTGAPKGDPSDEFRADLQLEVTLAAR